ncbi:uncharacterized protein LOC116118984 [Pistacia vera]|uniref:uncharacterized protein LOC116118984 n=1 Tax=Pistacia vera TaxID=55513 RepID=UPI001262AD8B|nr:uncharacterized protein LOC116118984 [Pistacia vera]
MSQQSVQDHFLKYILGGHGHLNFLVSFGNILLRSFWHPRTRSSWRTPPNPRSTAPKGPNPKKSLPFIKNAIKHKHSFIQLFAMSGILLLSLRSLGQKYYLHELEEDTSALKEEQESLTHRMNNIKSSLLHEASLESTSRFASRLRLLFGEEN